MEKPLLRTSKETAEMLGISRSTLHRWVKAGKIPCIRIEQNSVYFTTDDIDKFIEESRTRFKPINPTPQLKSGIREKGITDE
ncbi:helix-turn-helix domain-containing protein [bacterium]|nr:helix-turn-helix domain-containing protein [bacterium]